MWRIVACLVLSSCSEGLETLPQHSTAMASSGDALWIASASDDELVRFGFGSAAVLELEGEPTRVAAGGDRAFVSLRAARSLAVVTGNDDLLAQIGRAHV